MGRVAIDANVLIYAAGPRVGDASNERFAQCQAAQAIFDRGERIVVPAPAWFEALRRGPEHAAGIRLLGPQLDIEVADVATAERAAELMWKARGQEKLCPKCCNYEDAPACKSCGAKRAKSALLFDAMIVAIAEAQRCQKLYTFDEPCIRAFGHLARLSIDVPRPPQQPPLPLPSTPDRAGGAGDGKA